MRRHRSFFVPPDGIVAHLLAQLGHEVVVLTAELPEGGGLVEIDHGAEVHFLMGAPPKKDKPQFWTATVAAFDRLHAERPFDLVLGRGLATWGFLSQSRYREEVPVLLHEGTYPRWLHQVETRSGPLARGLAVALAPVFALLDRKQRLCMKRAARVICITPALATGLKRAYWWNPPRVRAITYGFDTTPYQPRDPDPAVAPRLVSVGRLALDKGIFRMIDVLAALKDRTAQLFVMGPGPDTTRQRLLEHARANHVADRYHLSDAVRNEDLPGVLAGSVAFVFPSTHAEGLGKVVLESMAAGVPVVAFRLPVLEGIIQDGVNGFLVPIRSVTAMADRLDQLLADPGLQARLGAAARQTIAAKFAPEAIAAQWQALLAEVVAEAGSRAS